MPTGPNATGPDTVNPADRALLASLLSLAWVVEARDSYTGGHQWRVARYAQRLATAVGMSRSDVARVAVGGFVHDLGKIGIPDSILHKAGRLDAGERAVLRTHPVIGLRALAAHPLAPYVRDIVVGHHEQPDGNGYPAGIAGAGIPAGARLVAIADAFDAMTSARPYRRALSRDIAVRRIADNLGTQFDPAFGAAFVALVRAGDVDDVLGHSDVGIPLHECAFCGNNITVPASAADGAHVYCASCRSEFRVRRAERTVLAHTGRKGGAADAILAVDDDLIARVVDESVSALLVP